MELLQHPERFRKGVRVIMLSARYKDGCEKKRNVLRVSKNPEQFERYVDELQHIALEGERIYASVSSRSIERASRLFRERQLQSEYDENPMAFYENLSTRWTSCLASKRARDDKLWLFDCDSDDELKEVEVQLELATNVHDYRYQYRTKTGHHIITTPFDLSIISEKAHQLLDQNGMMLWGF